MRRQFISYVSGASFVRDERQRLADNAIYRTIRDRGVVAHGAQYADVVLASNEPVPDLAIRARLAPVVIETEHESGSVWSTLATSDDYAMALPVRVALRLPIGLSGATPDGARVEPATWRSISVRGLVNAFGVGVSIRFGFDALPREAAAVWPGDDRRFGLRAPDGTIAWQGGIVGLAAVVADATLRAIGDVGSIDRRTQLQQRLKLGMRRVYAEYQQSVVPITTRLLYGLANGRPGWETVTKEHVQKAFRPRSLYEGERRMFVPSGGALLFTTPAQPHWRAANCARKNVTYSLAMHAMLLEHLEMLAREAAAGPGALRRELTAVLEDDLGTTLTRRRLAVLAELQRRFVWLRYYSNRRRLAASLGALQGALAEDELARIGAPASFGILLGQQQRFAHAPGQ
jgi:hypothetical protein